MIIYRLPVGLFNNIKYFLIQSIQTLIFFKFFSFSAHEITHAFDEVGIMYDSQAQFKPLYDNSTIKAFHNASDCIRKQYSTFR